MADPTKQTPKRAWLGNRWLLYGSLALNLLIVGLVLGAVIGGGSRGPGGGPIFIDSPMPLIRALDDTRRNGLRTVLDSHRSKDAGGPRARVRQTRALLDSLRSTPFDPAAFETLLNAQADALARRNTAGRAALFGAIAEMSDNERAAYADRIEEELRKRGSKSHRGDGAPRKPDGSKPPKE